MFIFIYIKLHDTSWDSQVAWHSGKESACHCRRGGFHPWVGKSPWRRKWQPTPVFSTERLTLSLFSWFNLGFPGGTSGKEPTCHCRRHTRLGFDLSVGKSPWRRKWQPAPVVLPGESRGQRSLAGYSLWGHKELETTE